MTDCKNRDNVYDCNEKITFVQAGVLDQPLYKGEQSDDME